MKRKLWLGMIGLAAASTAQAAIVTLTMSYNESPSSSAVATGSFTVYATVSQGDNRGLFAYGIDLAAADNTTTTLTALVNRGPHGVWNVDDLDPEYDPDNNSYPTYDGGFGTGRGANIGTGVVSGVQDLAKIPNLVRIYGFGQTPGTMDSNRPAPYQNDPAASNGGQVSFKPYTADANTDIHNGDTPLNTSGGLNNKSGVTNLPAGTIRLITGKWTGAAPLIQVGPTASTGISVWSLADPTPGQENKNEKVEGNNLVVQYRDWAGTTVTPATAVLGGTSTNTITPVGGNIAVSGSNGHYVSEVDPLSDPSLTKGSAPIVGIGDEAGFIYVMAKLNGTPAEIAAALASSTTDIDATSGDANFAALHAAYDSQFTGGSFNALFKMPNITGAKVFNYDFSGFPTVTFDQLAAVPEPATMGLMAFAGMGLLARRRRNRA